MATRGSGSKRARANDETEVDLAETNQPATARRYSDAEAKPVKISPEPVERPYGEAVTAEHREELARHGVKVTKSTKTEQGAATA